MRAAVTDNRLEAIAGPPVQVLRHPAPGTALTPAAGPVTVFAAIRHLEPADYLYDGRDGTARTYAWLTGAGNLSNGTTLITNAVFPMVAQLEHPDGINANVTVSHRTEAGKIAAVVSYNRALSDSEARHVAGLLSLSLSLSLSPADALSVPAPAGRVTDWCVAA